MQEQPNKTGQLILISRQLRLDLIDCQALDLTLSNLAFRIACIIGTHYGNKSGLAFLSLDYLKAVTGKSGPTVQRALSELEKKGYLIIARRSIGTRIWKGKTYPVYGGKGSANEYRPACDKVQITTLSSSKNLVDRVNEAWRERLERLHAKHHKTEVLSKPKHHADVVLSADQSTTFLNAKHHAGVVPTLDLLSEDNSTAPNGLSRADCEILRNRLGPGVYKSWFECVVFDISASGTIEITVPDRHFRTTIEERYATKVLDCFREIYPHCTGVEIKVKTP